jgi:hypothetical protein
LRRRFIPCEVSGLALKDLHDRPSLHALRPESP